MEEEIPCKKEKQTPEEEENRLQQTGYKGGIRISSSYGKTPGGFWGFPMEQEPISVNYRKKRR